MLILKDFVQSQKLKPHYKPQMELKWSCFGPVGASSANKVQQALFPYLVHKRYHVTAPVMEALTY